MPYFRKCDYCDAHLDPGERCDCKGQIAADALAQKGASENNLQIMSEAEHKELQDK